MFKNIDLITEGWQDYELLDSGENKKLERFGPFLVIRPETQALWSPSQVEEWKKAKAEFKWEGGKGGWKNKGIPEKWEMAFGSSRFWVKPTSFKHMGIFPEQAVNWEWLAERTGRLTQPKVLNLFGYTGIASLMMSLQKAEVTHVDSSKQSNTWSRENLLLSGLEEKSIRYVLEDALKFVEREKRRGSVYDGVILDPPAFGRGVKGEVWKIEEDLPRLLSALAPLLSPKPGSFFLLNGYAAGYSPVSLVQAVQDNFQVSEGEFGELQIKESRGKKVLPSGIYARFII